MKIKTLSYSIIYAKVHTPNGWDRFNRQSFDAIRIRKIQNLDCHVATGQLNVLDKEDGPLVFPNS